MLVIPWKAMGINTTSEWYLPWISLLFMLFKLIPYLPQSSSWDELVCPYAFISCAKRLSTLIDAIISTMPLRITAALIRFTNSSTITTFIAFHCCYRDFVWRVKTGVVLTLNLCKSYLKLSIVGWLIMCYGSLVLFLSTCSCLLTYDSVNFVCL